MSKFILLSVFYLALISCKSNVNNIKSEELISADTLKSENFNDSNIFSQESALPNPVLDCEECLKTTQLIDANINSITEKQIYNFLYCFGGVCENNAEFSEYSNEILFSLLSENPESLIKILDQYKNLPLASIKFAIENPVNDNLELQLIFSKVQAVNGYTTIRDNILQSIKIAIDKYK